MDSTYTSQDILALKERYNPEGSLLRRDQKELFRMLLEVAKICEQHHIQWWLAAGTLLGAARHKGFIPWDDDIDIFVLRKDYKKLQKILYKLQDEEFVYQCIRTDVEYVNCFGKFRKRQGNIQSKNKRHKHYKWKGIGLDIFAIEKTNYFAARAADVIYKNIQHVSIYVSCDWIRRPLIRFIELICLGVIIPILRLIGQINPKGEYHYMLGMGWPKPTFFEKDIFPLTNTEFEGVQMPVPKDMDAFLKGEFGDWRQIPSEESIKRSIHCQEYRDEIFGKNQ